MHEHGLVFEHTFSRQKLGFAIVLAKYGDEGRVFVQIEKTTPPCPLYPDTLRPSDERSPPPTAAGSSAGTDGGAYRS